MVASHGVSIIAEVVVTERGVLFKGAAGMRPAWCVIWIDVEAHTPRFVRRRRLHLIRQRPEQPSPRGLSGMFF